MKYRPSEYFKQYKTYPLKFSPTVYTNTPESEGGGLFGGCLWRELLWEHKGILIESINLR